MDSTPDDDQPDLVDEHFRPFVRALGNLVIMFALAEAKLLEMVSEMLSGVELKAVALLKSQDAKDQVLSLVRSIGLTGFDLEELLARVDTFWEDKATRNRLVHDEWFSNIYESASLMPLQSAPVLDAVDSKEEIRQRTTELAPRIVEAFLSAADTHVVLQLLEEEQ
jgi:hypothetical protein